MGWQIDLFRVLPGQDPCKVRDVQYEWEEHAGYEVGEPCAESDAWIAHVLGLLQTTEPAFEEVGERTVGDGGHVSHVGLVQPTGPCIVNVYPDVVDVRGKWGYADRYDGELFEQLWRCCRLLADEAGCAVFPQYDDEPTDMSLDVARARKEHFWA